MDRDKIILNLLSLGLFNDPNVKSKVDKIHVNNTCPTCDGRLKFIHNGVTVECDCFLQKILFRNYLASNIGAKFHTLDLDDFISEDRETVVPVVNQYLSNLENNIRLGMGITFNGPVGTGKTWPCAIF